MNKNAMYLLIVLILLVIGGTAYFLTQKGNTPTSNNVPANNNPAANGTDTQKNSAPEAVSGSLSDLLARATPAKCSYSMAIDSGTGGQTSGTVYAAGGKVRSDIAVNITGQDTTTMHVIVKDGFEYTWADSGPLKGTGMKLEISKLKAAAQGQTNQTNSVDPEKKLDMNCSLWAPDATQFELPAGVEFTDITQQTTQTIQNAPKNACDACKLMPTSQLQGQCQQANKCPGN